ncbi:MAG: hydrogenase maturation nickel metallochaperone HypA [Deltaproteobacteria bacterium]|nr:hydrogenase maturation nickel metallochaperone HypA [Deltaproteobacteria bacterium]MBW2537489.1 hydrogenase maturation nickel metallochaperone HypA [Deltaproteobacteria bacterium]
MHELGLAQGILRTVEPHVPAGQRLVAVVLEWGPLSGVVPEALETCWRIVAEAAGLGDARLQLLVVPGRGRCPACQAEFEVTEMWAECPACGRAPVTVSGGSAFRVKEIEVDDTR